MGNAGYIYICLFKHIYIYHHRRQQPYYLEHENKLNSEDSWQEPWPRREFAKAALKPKLLTTESLSFLGRVNSATKCYRASKIGAFNNYQYYFGGSLLKTMV